MLKRSLFICALMMSAAVTPVRADDLNNRMDQLQDQIRQLTGQVEELTYQMKQLQAQNQALAPKKMGQADQVAPQAVAPQPTQQAAAAPAAAPALPFKKKGAEPTIAAAASTNGGDVEQIGETQVDPQTGQPQIQGGLIQVPPQQAEAPRPAPQNTQMALAPKPQGMNSVKSSQPNDGGFQGQVLVPAGGDDQQQAAQDPNAQDSNGQAMAQPASLQAETPDDLYMRANQALLQRRFDDASNGFKDFLAKYPEHNLAGNAEFWLGESYWLQQDYTSAAQAYLNSYKQYPKSSRAPESLLKLGQSLSRMGQKDQACAAIGSVDTEFPKAVDVKKRAQAEFKREGCTS